MHVHTHTNHTHIACCCSYDKPVLFERHAVGGEYQAGYDTVGAGQLETVFTGEDGKKIVVDSRQLKDKVCSAYIHAYVYAYVYRYTYE